MITQQPLFDTIRRHLNGGAKILIAGNGGSAAMAQHLAAELMVRFVKDRHPIPAIALSTDTSIITACANDLGYEHVFSRQMEALCYAGDVVILMSTSGKSPNILQAARVAYEKGAHVVALAGGAWHGLSEYEIILSTGTTAEVQQAHLEIIHQLCEYLDEYA